MIEWEDCNRISSNAFATLSTAIITTSKAKIFNNLGNSATWNKSCPGPFWACYNTVSYNKGELVALPAIMPGATWGSQ